MKKFDPIPQNTTISNVTVLNTATGGPRSQVSYRVRYECCGSETVMRHTSLLDRERSGTTVCSSCARRARDAEIAAGSIDAVAASAAQLNIRVIDVAEAPLFRNHRFLVRLPCCGAEMDLGVTALRARIRQKNTMCRVCVEAAHGVDRSDTNRVYPREPTPESRVPIPDWPKPESVSSGRWIWGAR